MMVFLGGMMLAFLGERAGVFASKSWVYAVCFLGIAAVNIVWLLQNYQKGFVETYTMGGGIHRKKNPWAFFFCFWVYMVLMGGLAVVMIHHLWSLVAQ